MAKPYNPAIHYNHCIQCGEPILTEKERNAHLDEDGNPYHHACVDGQAELNEIWNEQVINIT